eukprot:493256-Alexandrium_andersonii.AAC.1
MAEVASRRRAIWLAEEVSPSHGSMSQYDDRTDPVLTVGPDRFRFADKHMPIGVKLFSRNLSLNSDKFEKLAADASPACSCE